MSRPFNFKINAAEFFTVISSLHHKQHSRFLVTFAKDLLTLSPETDYGKKVVGETLNFIAKQSEHGKTGGKPKHRQPKGSLKGSGRQPIGSPYPEVEVKEEVPYKRILDDLNQKGGYSFRPCRSVNEFINGRFAEGFTIDDFFHVHSVMVKKWKDDPKMCQYIRPSTLYRPAHFQEYLNIKQQETKRIMNHDGQWIEVPV